MNDSTIIFRHPTFRDTLTGIIVDSFEYTGNGVLAKGVYIRVEYHLPNGAIRHCTIHADDLISYDPRSVEDHQYAETAAAS